MLAHTIVHYFNSYIHVFQVAPISRFYGAPVLARSNHDVPDDSFYWQPGATLPLTSTPSRGATHRTTSYRPRSAGSHQLLLQSESEPEEDITAVHVEGDFVITSSSSRADEGGSLSG